MEEEKTNVTIKEVEKKRTDKKFLWLLGVGLVFFLLFLTIYFFAGHRLSFFGGSPEETQEPGSDIFQGFSKLKIDSVNAKDNFTLEALKSDVVGIEPDSSYLLKSKENIVSKDIKDSIKISPEVDFSLKKINEKEWEIIPKSSFEANKIVKIALDTSSVDETGDEKDYEYSWAFQVRDSFKVLHSIPREAGTNVPLDTGIEITFSHNNFYDYENYFSISPSVPGKFEVHDRTLVFVPSELLSSNSLYTVKVKAGLPINDSEKTLEEDYEFTFETRNDSSSNSWIGVYNRMIESNSFQSPAIKISSYNAPNLVDVKLFQFKDAGDYLEAIKDRDKLPWWSYSKEAFLFNSSGLFSVASFSLDVKSGENSKYIEFPSPLDKGFYLAELSSGEGVVQVWIQVSDLVVYANITKTDSIVWVNSPRTDGPVSSADLRIIGLEGGYKTNEKGVAVFPTPNEILEQAMYYKNDESYYLDVAFQGDELIIPASKISRNYFWETPSLADDYWLYMYTDRPRYQSTDVINYWGVLKDREEKKIDEKVTVSLYKQGYVDYYYRPVKVYEEEVSVSDIGSYSGEIEIKNLKPDYYTLELSINGEVLRTKYLSINPYVKPAYSLSLVPDKKHAYVGDQVNFKVTASFFEGTPVPDLDLIFTSPTGKEKVKTDENGEVDLTFTKRYTECSSQYGCWPDYEYFYVEPENSELAEINADSNVIFYAPNVYISTKIQYPEKGFAELEINSKYYDLEKMAVDNWWEKENEDKDAPNVHVKGEVYKITYTKEEKGTYYDYINKRTYKSYQYTRKEEKVNDLDIFTDNNGYYKIRQAVEEEVSYEFRLKTFDERGYFENSINYIYYYDGKSAYNYSNWWYEYYHFNIDGNNTAFHVGDKVRAEFMNNNESMPERENGYLFLQLRNGLQEFSLSNSGLYEFNFNKNDIPNINLVGVYFDGVRYLKTQTGYYGSSVRYDINDSRLKIKVNTDKEKYVPGEKVNLDILVTDKDDNPVQAEVNLNLVDEAYYAVVNDSASPLETIYANIGPGTLLAQSTHEDMAADSTAEKGGCFLAGTKVLMKDGSYKSIEKIKEGDMVSTFSDPFEQRLVYGEVREIWKHYVPEYLIINKNLRVTPEHQIYSNYRFIDAGLLKKGDWLLNSSGEKVYVKSIKIVFEPVMVYNLRVDPQHTFFAGDFYVHNQEKGGGAREFFTDAALFEVIKTNSNGRGKTSFVLPDNITSWRVTAQGITDEVFAGVSVTKIPVSLPVFSEVTIGDEYLENDRPVVRLRAFGTALKAGDKVEFSISSDTLNFNEDNKIISSAFEPTFFELPELTKGEHQILYNLETESGDDAIKLPMNVISSRFEVQEAINSQLTLSTKIISPTEDPFVIAFLDQGQNVLYNPLLAMAWSWGDRVDQKLVRKEATALLNHYYKTDYKDVDFPFQDYQLDNGGISLLPYSEAELELTLRIANLGIDVFDNQAMKNYFFNIFENTDSNREELTYSLCGLAALGEPVLPRLNDWLKREDLGPKEKIYLALAFVGMGDKGTALQIYYDVLSSYGEEKDPYITIRVDGAFDSSLEITSLMAILSTSLEETEAYNMFSFVEDNQVLYGYKKNSENLFNLEKLAYVKKSLPNLNPQKAKVVFELSGEREEADITGGSIYSFMIDPSQAESVKFLEVEGDVGISLRYTKEKALEEVEKDSELKISREYYVNGIKTNEFKENDLVEIRIYPKFGTKALSGQYQITDILPSGLSPVTKMYQRNRTYDCSYWYPYNRDGQMVKFIIDKDWKSYYCGGSYFKYYARIKNKGSYEAEPAVLQSFVNPEFINFSEKGFVTIN